MKTTQTDVLILGAGITGLVTAFKLNKAGKKVVMPIHTQLVTLH